MKRNRHNDWTDVLRERLLEAKLPLESADISTFSGVGGLVPRGRKKRPRSSTPQISRFAGAPHSAAETPPERQPAARRGWGIWALAGVAAAAVLAAVLLRPAPQPEPDRLVESPAAVPDKVGMPDQGADRQELVAEVSGGAGLVPEGQKNTSPPTLPTAPDSTGQRAQATAQPAHRLPQDSASVTPGLTRSLLAEERKEIPDRAGDDRKADGADVQPLSELALADLPEVQERGRRRPVSLRLQTSVGARQTGGSPLTYSYLSFPGYVYGAAVGEVNQYQQDINRVAPQQNLPFPISFGVSAMLPVARRWSVSAGLEYTQRGGQRVVSHTYAAASGQQVSTSVNNVTLHYLGLPVDARFYFNPDSRLRFYLGAGLMAEKCVYVKGAEALRDPFLFSGSLLAGADLRILRGVRIYLAPSVDQYFNRSAYNVSWDDHPVFSLHAGLSFDLN